MKKGYIDITLVLDRSGSMQDIREATQDGVNEFINKQKLIDGNNTFTLIKFDDQYERTLNNIPLKDVQKVKLEPRGMTALLDAIGITINDKGKYFRKLPENERPEKVIFVIVTDGQENSSKEFRREKIFDMIKKQTEKYSWEFVFLGANQDAIATAVSYGINATSAMTYSSTSHNTTSMFVSLASAVSGYSQGISKSVLFTKKDRTNAVK